ncbi:thioredoxin fold domain-containing protein [Adhaeribacter aquaticus]|uniref:thioredoxin fold domain-containing protein n=1 Tax=Adhaeribacter aquaticus TaxID=299567 RepID=UPI00040CF3E8|nr:thioredoxin fold domain-containing protein [Adhaeribacter aquaticus]
MKAIFTLIISSFISLAAIGQQSNAQIGQPVSNLDFLRNITANKAVVIVFVNNTCPNSRLYESRLQTLANAYSSQGVNFVFVNVPINMQDSGGGVKELAQIIPGGNLSTSISDENLKISSQLGATKTPEVFLLQNQNGQFILKYKGAIDDNPQLSTSVKDNYLRDALEAVVNNRTVTTPERRSIGCLIKRY